MYLGHNWPGHLPALAHILHEGNEVQGNYGKQYWSIARRCIAVATHQGGSIKIGSQIFPDFVQVQTVISVSYNFCAQLFALVIKEISCHRLRAICGLD